MSIANEIEIDYTRFPESDGVPLDSAWQREQINLLVHSICHHRRGRRDFYAGGNMFIYYDPDDPRKVVGPDFFCVNNVDQHSRLLWAVWKEDDRYPNAIVELISKRSRRKDTIINKAIYQDIFHTAEYFVFDPKKKRLEGWRLESGVYEPLAADADGRMWSDELDLGLGPWFGAIPNFCEGETWWLRFLDSSKKFVPFPEEYERQQSLRHQQRADQESKRADQESKRADQESKRADQESKRAERESRAAVEQQRRAEAAEIEVARLKKLLEERGIGGPDD